MHACARLSALAAVLALAGCSTGDVDDEAKGGTLTVYVSAPLSGGSGEEGRAIVNGAKLALADADGQAGGLDVEAIYMDDTSGRGAGARWDPVVTADNARRAAQDSTAIAYIGELESGATRTSLPITNQAFMLQVSAGSTAVDLARESSASDDVPDLYQPTGERTFGRVIPDDEKQAGAGAVWAKRLDGERRVVVEDGSDYGEIVAAEFEEEASALGVEVTGSTRLAGLEERSGGFEGAIRDLFTPALVYLAGESPKLLPVAVTSESGASSPILLASDALLGAATRSAAISPAGQLRVTSSAQDPKQLPAAGQRFVRAYEREFGGPPNRYAAYGYEAMAVVLDSIDRAADPRDRSAVIDAFFATADRDSVLGKYSIDEAGNTTLDAIAGYRIERGEPRFDTALRAP